MSKKDKSPTKILKQAAAKAKAKKVAEERNKSGALIRTLDKPEGQYTKAIKCVECGAERKVKPQDAWQVKRCSPCQDKRRGGALKQLVARKADPNVRKEEARTRAITKLESWVERTNDEVMAGFEKMKAYKERAAAEPKQRRIWP